MQGNRLKYDKPSYYSKKVLVGNWFEETIGRYSGDKYKSFSTYTTHFNTKHSVDKEFNDVIRNDIQIKSECSNISPSRNQEGSQNYFDNFTTSYDLSYQYFPQWINGYLPRKLRFALLKYEPTEEYLSSFGNLSSRNNYTHIKRQEWECDMLDPRRPLLSTHQNDFPKYDEKEYQLNRWARPVPIKAKYDKVTEIIYPKLPQNHPRVVDYNCNPITWMCTDEIK
ncbi:uncharacterized protein LOC143191333 [Rhynchophorus ferrugineus]|uniref:uncharacterized protein LOC143191333 n=1 Tax=Rhynchophorus ferrugineus TaxID=354439 RepID=UPI003FCD422F